MVNCQSSKKQLNGSGMPPSFKVGFETIDKRVNHFMINLPAENYKEFISELFKYLKILKKI